MVSKVIGSNDPRLAKATGASLSDALGRRHGHRAHVLDLVSPTPERVLFGKAVTIRYVPLRADVFNPKRHNFARLLYEAIGASPPEGEGRVLVLSSSGHPQISLAGGIKLSRLHNLKLAGVVTDGRLRDFDELKKYSISAWCSGETVPWGGNILMPLEANVPVTLGGITVFPGDYIFASRSALVAIPSNDMDWVLSEATSIEEQDRHYMDRIKREDPEKILRDGSPET